jgi:hypothetical protein
MIKVKQAGTLDTRHDLIKRKAAGNQSAYDELFYLQMSTLDDRGANGLSRFLGCGFVLRRAPWPADLHVCSKVSAALVQ